MYLVSLSTVNLLPLRNLCFQVHARLSTSSSENSAFLLHHAWGFCRQRKRYQVSALCWAKPRRGWRGLPPYRLGGLLPTWASRRSGKEDVPSEHWEKSGVQSASGEQAWKPLILREIFKLSEEKEYEYNQIISSFG